MGTNRRIVGTLEMFVGIVTRRDTGQVIALRGEDQGQGQVRLGARLQQEGRKGRILELRRVERSG